MKFSSLLLKALLLSGVLLLSSADAGLAQGLFSPFRKKKDPPPPAPVPARPVVPQPIYPVVPPVGDPGMGENPLQPGLPPVENPGMAPNPLQPGLPQEGLPSPNNAPLPLQPGLPGAVPAPMNPLTGTREEDVSVEMSPAPIVSVPGGSASNGMTSMPLSVEGAPNPNPGAPAPVDPAAPVEKPRPPKPKTTGPGFQSSYATTKGARILELTIPAPRGQIVDRNGVPLAQNVVTYYLGLNFPYMEGATDAEIVKYAKERLATANATLGASWSLEDADILDHYKMRRWLPLIFSRMPLLDEQRYKIEELNLAGLILHPTYDRIYPQGKLASHIIGYVGNRGPWPKGEVPDREAMWPVALGMRGLEKSYDEYLMGSPGRVKIIFNERGERVEETVIQVPVPGHNIVTSIDVEMQRLTETIIGENVKRGAFVITDVQTGDLLAMASYPEYDPNEFIPRISQERFDALNNDPELPMLGRAFQGVYPPASTFKVISALGMLESGRINEYTTYGCPTSFQIGNRTAHNWAKEDEGYMNVMGALKRSCNTWFYQAGIETGVPYITSMGETMGFGRRVLADVVSMDGKTSVTSLEESVGTMPTNDWHRKRFGYPISDGDLINICIGQGTVEATPLQVCQAMNAVANRQYLVEPRLVLQVQDYADGIVKANEVKRRRLNVSQHSLAVVHRGMYDVVNGGGGTGHAASNKNIHVSGKTGTGQWRLAIEQNVAWFGGFAPSEYPVYAFAAVYEGEPGEKVGGGSKVAPMVGEFFEKHLTEAKLAEFQQMSDQIRINTEHIVEPMPQSGSGSIFVNGAPVVPEPAKPGRRPDRPNGGGGGGIFRKIFGQ